MKCIATAVLCASLAGAAAAEPIRMTPAEVEAALRQNEVVMQQRIKAASDRIAAARSTVDGIGQHTMSVDFDSYIYWNNLLPGCWKDKGFREEFKKSNPHTVVTTTAKPTIVVQ